MRRPLLLAGLFIAGLLFAATAARAGDETIAPPVLRATVNVASEVVRIGDVVDNAGAFAQVPIYRAPDLGTTGSLPVAQVLNVLRAQGVIGVDAKDIKQVMVTRRARTVEARAIEIAVAQALEHRNGLGDAANINLTFDRDVADLRLDASNTGAMLATSARYEPRNGRFDVTFQIANDNGNPTQLRFTGSAIETVEVAVLTRNVERSDMLKSADVVVERRPRAEVGSDAAGREHALGMQMRRSIRAGQPLRIADLARPDLVQRDQAVSIIFQTAGLYLTTRGKALDNGTEGDVVSVLNIQSKRTVTGTVTGRGQITIQIATPAPTPDTASTETMAAPTAVASDTHSPVTSKPE
ncbi:MAG TPA: flagellar basal body P-ring formation chaperone FlgA [Bradyrhizobium sp.]